MDKSRFFQFFCHTMCFLLTGCGCRQGIVRKVRDCIGNRDPGATECFIFCRTRTNRCCFISIFIIPAIKHIPGAIRFYKCYWIAFNTVFCLVTSLCIGVAINNIGDIVFRNLPICIQDYASVNFRCIKTKFCFFIARGYFAPPACEYIPIICIRIRRLHSGLAFAHLHKRNLSLPVAICIKCHRIGFKFNPDRE